METTVKCTQCGSNNLVEGKMGVHRQTFLPKGRLGFKGYELEAFACLACGNIEKKLSPNELEKLKQSFEK